MKVNKVVVSSAFIILFSCTSFAAPGIFVGANLGASIANTANIPSSTDSALSYDTIGGAVNLNVGYNWSDYVGVELDADKYGNLITHGSNNAISDASFYGVGPMLDFNIPFYESSDFLSQASFFVKGGMEYIYKSISNNTQDDETNTWFFTPKLTAGINMETSKNWGFNFSYSHIWGKSGIETGEFNQGYLPDFDVFQLGLTYNFS